MTATKAWEVATLAQSTESFRLLGNTERYVRKILYNQISFAASNGRNHIVHILPKDTIRRWDAARMLIDEEFKVALIGRLLIVKWN